MVSSAARHLQPARPLCLQQRAWAAQMHRYGTRGTKKTEGEGNVARTKPTAPKPPAPKAAAAPKRPERSPPANSARASSTTATATTQASRATTPRRSASKRRRPTPRRPAPRLPAASAAKKKVEAAAKALEKRTKGCAVVVKCTMARGRFPAGLDVSAAGPPPDARDPPDVRRPRRSRAAYDLWASRT